jgi:thiaminase/transcriptional activator TenA
MARRFVPVNINGENMSKFSHQSWSRNVGLFEKIMTLPFNKELMDGTLSQSRFKHYMIQDAYYLEGFARALSFASAKGHNVDHIVHFADAAQTAILVERSLHADFFVKFGVSRETFETAEPTPVCEHYISYIIRVAALEPFEVLLAALLPCFWIYREVGRKIHERAAPNNPYKAWIDTYAGEEFEKAVDSMISVVDGVARDVSPRTLKGMHHAFRRSTQLEWMFWDSAYLEKGWPV